MEHSSEIENFKRKTVLAVCAAGTDRSRYISDELNARGYFATAAGVLKNHNYVTESDLADVGIIVFASVNEKKVFEHDRRLKKLVDVNGIEIRVMSITENDKNKAHNTNQVESLKATVRQQLDCVGLKNLNT